jgi:predicted metal-dependent hydrolase
MLDWLRRGADDMPQIELGGQTLPVVIRRLANARRLTMRLAPDGSEVRVTMPRWGQTREALDFAKARAGWLEAQLAKVQPVQALMPGAILPFRGAALAIDHQPSTMRRVKVLDDSIQLGGPAESIAPRLQRWLSGEARRLLMSDLAEYCARAGKPMPKLALSAAQRRWGSCSARGAIRINWRLVMAPDHVRRSVVAHEVAHLIHFDHSQAFHALLGEIYEGNIAEANSWLRRHGRGLYAHFG